MQVCMDLNERNSADVLSISDELNSSTSVLPAAY